DVELDFDRSLAGEPAIWDRFIPARPNRLASIVVDGDAVSASSAPPPRGHIPAWRGAATVPVAHEYHLNAQAGGPFGIAWTIDGLAFAPVAGRAASSTRERGPFPHLRFPNAPPRIPPMPLHGMFFRLLARGGSAIDEPFFRDTVLIHPRESIDI